MYKIDSHPILDIPKEDIVEFEFEGRTVRARRGQTVGAALHQAGYPVHQHSLENRNRTMECGIGKCGACEMLVDGSVRRICITEVDGVRNVRRVNAADMFTAVSRSEAPSDEPCKIYRTTVAVIGAGPAGLAAREELNRAGVDNIVIDNNSRTGGQFRMQTHQFFFFEKEHKFGGMRGFDIAGTLAGESSEGIMLNCVVWDILEGRRIAVKNIVTQEIFYIDADALIVATGAVPFLPAFRNDDLPGVYTATVFQMMMNRQFTLLGRNVLTVGAGNIGYLTSYQAIQAGAKVKAIIEAMPREGGFPVQANRVRRLGVPIMTGYTLVEAIPNTDRSGITGAIIAESRDFKPVPGTEVRIDGIDCINICTGLIPDNTLFRKGTEVFGRACYAAGDSVRIGEGTSAVLRGRQCAYEVMMDMPGRNVNYQEYLNISRDYIESQQRPVRVLQEPVKPSPERMSEKGFVIADCLYGFACNPCSFSCRQGAITKASASSVPVIDYDKCIGCMECISHCPGLAFFGYNTGKHLVYLPLEFKSEAGTEVFLVDDNGAKVGEGSIDRIMVRPNRTNVAVITVNRLYDGNKDITCIRGFISKADYPEPLELKKSSAGDGSTYICHCEDVTIDDLLKAAGNRKTITAQELKHITRLGMGTCRGTRCLPRAKQVLLGYGITVTGDFTPRGPLANLVEIGSVSNAGHGYDLITSPKVTEQDIETVGAFVAGGGMAGSATFRYLAEAGFKPVLINKDSGSSWRCIAGGRPAFSLPALADIADHNLEIFRDLQSRRDINLKMTRYVNFAHDNDTYRSLDASRAWSDAYMVDKKDFAKEISPYINPALDIYSSALISNNCWQATPGKTIDLVRAIGESFGGRVMENTELVNVQKNGGTYRITVRRADGIYANYETEIFVNALGADAGKFASQLGIETGLYPVRHQAFITKRLPLIGKDGDSLDMLIDRRHYKGFSAVYGQQLAETGQIIGCASPATDCTDAGKNLKVNTQEFLEIAAEVFTEWVPRLKGMSFQATWCGYYTEPRYIVDPGAGLFVGMRGHGFMLSQYIGRMYVDSLLGRPVPDYFRNLTLDGKGLSEQAFK